MLLYYNRGFLRLILAKTGSIIGIKVLLSGFLVAGFTFGLAWLIGDNHKLQPEIPHHYGIMVIGSIASFALVYRTNLGWQRYWEAMTQQHYMYSKWSDTFAQFYAFATVSMAAIKKKGGAENEAKADRLEECIDRVERNFSLLSAFAAHRLTHGDNERMEQRTKVAAKWSDRLVRRRDLRVGEDLTAATAMPTFSSVDEVALAQELATRGSCSPKRETVEKTFGGIRSSSSAPVDNAWTADFRVLRNLSTEEWTLMAATKDRTSAVMYWIIHDLAEISADMTIAPPIQSRMYQELSNGMLGFNNSLKIADVPFPFPYAQLLTWILIAFSCLIPFYVAVFTTSLIMAPVAAFVAFVGMWSINEVAIELENPFGSDDNDISCWDFHERFLEGLIEQRGVHAKKVSEQVRVKDLKQAKKSADSAVVRQEKEENKEIVQKANPAPPVKLPLLETKQESKAAEQIKLSPSPAAAVAEVFDRQLAEITGRIEQRLTLILRELKAGSHAGNPAIIGVGREFSREGTDPNAPNTGVGRGKSMSSSPQGSLQVKATVHTQPAQLTGDMPCPNRGDEILE